MFFRVVHGSGTEILLLLAFVSLSLVRSSERMVEVATSPADETASLFFEKLRKSEETSWLADVPPPLRDGETPEQRAAVDRILNEYWRHVGNPYQRHDAGKQFTYGEVTPLGSRQLLQAMGLWNSTYIPVVLYDLGSGTGKFVVQAYLEQLASRAVGIELSLSRHNMAEQAWKSITAAENYTVSNHVVFRNQNILEADFSDATHIYTSSLCFPKEVVASLARRIVEYTSSNDSVLQTVAALSDLAALEETGGWDKSMQEVQTTWGRGRVRVYHRRR